MNHVSMFKNLFLSVCLALASLAWGQATSTSVERTQTSDGQAYETLSEADRDMLSFKEGDAYDKWRDKKQIAELKRLDEENARLAKEEVIQLHEYIVSIKRLHGNRNRLGFDPALHKRMQNTLKNIYLKKEPMEISQTIENDIALKRAILE